MATSALVLDYLIPRSSIELGRLVVNPQHPQQDFHQPLIAQEDDATLRPVSSASSSASTLQKIENFNTVVRRTSGFGLQAKLSNLLSVGPVTISWSSQTSITTPLCITHQLQNPDDYFEEACRNETVRKWLERQFRGRRGIRRPMGRAVYLVCGLKSLTDASFEKSDPMEVSSEAFKRIPLTSLSGLPISQKLGFDVELGGQFLRSKHDNTRFTAPGEQVFAVQYRRVKFNLFSSRDIDNAFLEDGNQWKMYIIPRSAGDEESMKDTIRADVDDALSSDDFQGVAHSCSVGSDDFFIWVDGDY